MDHQVIGIHEGEKLACQGKGFDPWSIGQLVKIDLIVLEPHGNCRAFIV